MLLQLCTIQRSILDPWAMCDLAISMTSEMFLLAPTRTFALQYPDLDVHCQTARAMIMPLQSSVGAEITIAER